MIDSPTEDGSWRLPGVFIIKRHCKLKDLVAHLELVAYAGEPDDYRDQITLIP